MMANDFLELKIPAKAEYVGVARLFISGVASRLQFTFEEIEDIKIAVAEACTNAVDHAYNGEDGQMIVGCSVYQDRLEIMVIDHGQSFNIKEVRKQLGPIDRHARIEDLNEGGLGLFLIETLMDKVEISDNVEVSNSKGIAIVMTKHKRRNEVVHNEQQPTGSKTTS